MIAAVIYLVLINATAFILMLVDKKKAKKHRRKNRIPEKVLMGTAILGGSIGALAGMDIFRHKTKHKKFTVGIPIIMGVQVLLVYLLLMFL